MRIVRPLVVAAIAGGAAVSLAPCASAQEALFSTRSLVVETASKAAQAALESCRKAGYQVTVVVVDRAGVPQALLRDRFAGGHTVDMAINKAWTAASFRIPTADLAQQTQAGEPLSGLRDLPKVIAVGGGLPIEAGGSTVGAIGVSGAPGGDSDASCARAGIEAIEMDIES